MLRASSGATWKVKWQILRSRDGIAGYSETLGVVEDDVGILMGDARVEPGEAAACKLRFGRADSMKDCVGCGDVAL